MCGYNPFYWYEKDLDDEYKERFAKNGNSTVNEQGTGTEDIRSYSRNDGQPILSKIVSGT